MLFWLFSLRSRPAQTFSSWCAMTIYMRPEILILYEVIYLNSNEKLEEYHEIGKGGLWGELSCINVKHFTSSQQRAVSWLGQTPLGRELKNLFYKN